MSGLKKKDLHTRIQGTEKICKKETEDDVKQIKQEACQIVKLPPHLTCSVCSGLLTEPVELPCCKTALCKLCAFVKLERHTACWFGFCPKSIPLSKERVKVSAKLAIQVDLWRILKMERFKESSVVSQVKAEKIVDARVDIVPRREYLQLAKPILPMKMKEEKQLQTNTDCFEVKNDSTRSYLPMKMKGEKQLQTNADCFESRKYSVGPNPSMKKEKQLQTNEYCNEVKNYSARHNLPMKIEREKQLQTNEDCLLVKNYSGRPNLPMTIKEEILQTNNNGLKIENNSSRLSPPIIEIKEESMSPIRMTRWVNVCGNEEEVIDIVTEKDGTLLLSSVRSQFPGTTGLKYRNPVTNNFCRVHCYRGILFPPRYEGWSGLKFVCERPDLESNNHKRKTGEEGQMSNKNIKVNEDKTKDLIIQGLPCGIVEGCVRRYFEKFGKVISVQINRRPICNVYLRFVKKEVEEKVLSQKHMFLGRWYKVHHRSGYRSR